jgi:hypothetical protein
MPYLGNVPAENYAQVSYQDLTGGSGTSFTLDYPVGSAGEIEVFVNNVRQEPTVAYTVNGTALTMTGSVAATDDFYVVFQGKAEKSGTIPEKQSDGTYVFPDDVTVSGNITSTGIDDNATSTAMTLDSSGNLLVGKTAASSNNIGFEAKPTGFMAATRDGNTVSVLNRLTSDGTLVDFRKDGSSVGSIGTDASTGDFYVQSQITNHAGLGFKVNEVLPRRNGYVDGIDNLGSSTYRFSNLYLSGGVYLGGTGSANYLNDVEYGTYSIDDASSASLTLTVRYAIYKKVGQLVHVEFDIDYPSNTNGANARLTIPFTPNVTYFSGIVGWSNNATPIKIHGASSGAYLMDCGNPSAGNIHLTNANLSATRIIGSFYFNAT